MKINILTLLPQFYNSTDLSIMGQAKKDGFYSLNIINIKDYGIGTHKKVDDTIYGGGNGLVIRADVLSDAIEKNNLTNTQLFITSPRGKKFNQSMAKNLSLQQEITIICTRFEGVDQRFIDYYNVEEVSIGDYILFGGDSACVVMLESIVRLIDGVINKEAVEEDSFSENFEGKMEYNHYTKPQVWKDMEVPSVLQSGNHLKIKQWRRENLK